MAARESLFDVLKRSPWWLSFAIAIGIAASLQVFFPWAFALFAALPFAVIAGYSAWKQRGIPGEARTASVLGELRALNREAFFAVIGDSYRSAGFQVDPHDGADADFRLTRGGRSVLLEIGRAHV